MIEINLIDLKDETTVEYFTITKFSDDQYIVELNKTPPHLEGEDEYDRIFRITTRCTWKDLQLLLVVAATLRQCNIRFHILITYLIGGRSDRIFNAEMFNYNQCHYLRDVISPILNNCGAERIYILDPHSDVSLGCIKNSQKADMWYDEWIMGPMLEFFEGTKCLIVPDAGALKKAYDISGDFDNMMVCHKRRDIKTGAILGVDVPFDKQYKGYDNYIVVDDIIDGGATFEALGTRFKELYKKPIHLYATHGIFSKGTKKLLSIYDTIHTTNSYQDIKETKNIKVYKLL